MVAAQADRALPGLARLSIAGCEPFVALVHEGRAQALADWSARRSHPLLGTHDVDALLTHWAANAPVLADALPDADAVQPLERFRLHAPVEPRQVFCTIGNYRAQLLEAMLDADPAGRTAHLATIEARRQGEPYAVLKAPTSVAGANEALPLAPDQATLDWEVEIGAVIGTTARNIRVQDALAHVAGYCTVNDITLRERLFRAQPKGMGTDFLQAKGGPGWLPVGPLLVPAAHVPDPQALQLRLALNGEVMQDGRADDMVFGIAEQIAYLSRHVRLNPGDIVCTGSPAGFGSHHKRFLRAGDLVTAEVIGLGAQSTRIQPATA